MATPNNLINERLDSVEETLFQLQKKIEKIYDVVVGNEEFGQKGIIKRLTELERENEKLKALKNKFIGASVVCGGLFTLAVELIKFMLKK
jgi:septation ring formation regulator EzrA